MNIEKLGSLQQLFLLGVVVKIYWEAGENGYDMKKVQKFVSALVERVVDEVDNVDNVTPITKARNSETKRAA